MRASVSVSLTVPVHVPVMPGPQALSPSTDWSALTSGKTGLFAVGSPSLLELGCAPGLAPCMEGRASERPRIPTATQSLEQRVGISAAPRSVHCSEVHRLPHDEPQATRPETLAETGATCTPRRSLPPKSPFWPPTPPQCTAGAELVRRVPRPGVEQILKKAATQGASAGTCRDISLRLGSIAATSPPENAHPSCPADRYLKLFSR